MTDRNGARERAGRVVAMAALLLALLISPIAVPVIAFARSIGRTEARTEQVVPTRRRARSRLVGGPG